MQFPDLNRRDFTKFAAAAVGGLVAGLSVGRAADGAKKKDPKKDLLLQEPHICRGLNPSCKSEVNGKKNDCAGMAYGPTAKEHVCKGHNDCAGLGGCGEHPGENKCKEMGECAVPLKD
jgi:anaerobic selenocysteine-containing dehydrogenase